MTEFDPRLAVEYGGLIAVAYDMFAPMDAPFNPPKMPDGFKFVARVIMTDYFLNKTYPEVYGLIAQRTDLPNAFVLAIRGTADGVEWWPNLQSAVGVEIAGLGKLAEGFERVFQTIQVIGSDGKPTTDFGVGQFVEQVAATAKLHAPQGKLLSETTLGDPNVIKIEVCGHSLGSALATLYVARNADSRKLRTPILYTFASPRVGDAQFVEHFNKLGINSWRIENSFDAVCALPTAPPLGIFEHVDQKERLLPMGVHADPLCFHDMNTYLNSITRKYSFSKVWPLSPGCDDTTPPDPAPHIVGH